MSRRGRRTGTDRKRTRTEAPDGQSSSSSKEPRRARELSAARRGSTLFRDSHRPRFIQGQDSDDARDPRATDLPTNVPFQQPAVHPHGPENYGRHPLHPEPESFRRDHYTRAPSPIRSTQPHDPWPGHGYYEHPRMERDAFPRPLSDYSQTHPYDFYRQRTPEYHRHQTSELLQHRPSFESRGPPSDRMLSDPRRRQSRSRSPAAAESTKRSMANRTPAATNAKTGNDLHVAAGKQEQSPIKCGNCKREGHEVKDCVSKIGSHGYVNACPRCNSNRHLYFKCPADPHAPGTRESEEDDVYYLLTCRQNKPQIRSSTDLGALVRWATPSLAAFPWTAAFALRYHEDPRQAAAERDYDYRKHQFPDNHGGGGVGHRPDREALTRKFDPSHPAIPKVPIPTTLPVFVPLSLRDHGESHQEKGPHDGSALVDSALEGVNTHAEALRISGRTETVHATQHLPSPYDSAGTASIRKSTGAGMLPPDGGDGKNKAAVPALGNDVETKEGRRTGAAVGALYKAAEATSRGGYAETWEAFVEAEIDRIEREKTFSKKSSGK